LKRILCELLAVNANEQSSFFQVRDEHDADARLKIAVNHD